MHTSFQTGQASVCAPTIEDVIAPYLRYPKAIQNAVMRALTHPTLSVLTKSMRKVLSALLTRASKADGTERIKARVDRLASEADVSDKTVQRTIATLRKFGWLRKMSDGRSEYGLFTYREYQFTRALCELVELPVPGKESPQEPKMSDGSIKDLSFKKDQLEISRKNRKGKIDLPPELEQAGTELEIELTGICRLRGLAHTAGHQLQDIIVVAKAHLSKLKATGNRAYCYLERMIGRDSDYARRATQIACIEAAPAAAPAEHYRNKRYVGPDGMLVRIFDGLAEVVMDDGRIATLAGANMQQVYARIESGVLREIAD